MMKTMILLVIAAACVSAAPANSSDRHVLMSVYDALNNTLKHLPEGFFLKDLKVENHRTCSNEFFCQTETELRFFMSGLSGAKFEPFRTDKELIRNLNVFNSRHHKKPCPSGEMVTIPLRDFLEDLRKCLQMKIRNKK